MKKMLMILAIAAGLTACGNGVSAAKAESAEKDRVEVIYFYGKQCCATCMAIEVNSKAVVDSLFADEVRDGRVVFRAIDITTPEGERMADAYEVSWSSLFIDKWQDGRQTCDNMTAFSFGNARKNPEKFKSVLAEKIRQALK